MSYIWQLISHVLMLISHVYICLHNQHIENHLDMGLLPAAGFLPDCMYTVQATALYSTVVTATCIIYFYWSVDKSQLSTAEHLSNILFQLYQTRKKQMYMTFTFNFYKVDLVMQYEPITDLCRHHLGYASVQKRPANCNS